MSTINIKVINKSSNPLPEYKTSGSSGMDLQANLVNVNENLIFNGRKLDNGSYILSTKGRMIVPTGLFMAIPEGYEAQIRPRSGLAAKFAITCTNAVGTIDADYRGEIGVEIINLGDEAFVINQGDRIAQIVFAEVTKGNLIEANSLDDTDRGDGGFGHTGV